MHLAACALVGVLAGSLVIDAGIAEAGQVGIASYYKYGGRTASGERFNARGLTAAHRTLKFGTRVKVTNVKTGGSVVVRINDRGPFVRNRIIDLSYGAAQAIGFGSSGMAKVSLAVLE